MQGERLCVPGPGPGEYGVPTVTEDAIRSAIEAWDDPFPEDGPRVGVWES